MYVVFGSRSFPDFVGLLDGDAQYVQLESGPDVTVSLAAVGNIGGSDAGLLINFENYMISWDPAADAALFEAADVNGDGNVNAIDAGIIVNVENYLMTIDQTTGLANIL